MRRSALPVELGVTVGPAAGTLFDPPTQSLLVTTTAVGDGFDASSHVVVAKLGCSVGP